MHIRQLFFVIHLITSMQGKDNVDINEWVYSVTGVKVPMEVWCYNARHLPKRVCQIHFLQTRVAFEASQEGI